MSRNFKDPEYVVWRKKVYARDGYKCQMPGCPSKGYLEAHHIVRWAEAASLRYEITNGITLCKKCHKSIKNREKEYETMFKNIVLKGRDGKISQALIDLYKEKE